MVRAVQTRSSVGRVSTPSVGRVSPPSSAVLRRPSAAVLRRPSAAVVVPTVTVKGTTYTLPEGFTPAIAKQVIMIEVDTKKNDSVFVPQHRVSVGLPRLHFSFCFFNTHNFGHQF